MIPRYELLVKIASGGMGGVYVGRLRSVLGFEQLVAIKRPHPHLMESPDVKRSLLAEAHMASQIRHANVVGVRDVEVTEDSILLVMDYVEGASLVELIAAAEESDRSELVRAGLRVVLDVCAGLQAVHELSDAQGQRLGLVHRDVSPHNVLVGLDGVARLSDFGIAKMLNGSDPQTREGIVKGKVGYMAPEYLQGHIDQRCDVFSLGVVLWELLVGQRLFAAESDAQTLHRVLSHPVPLVSEAAPALGTAFDGVVARALERDVPARFGRAIDLMNALEAAMVEASLVATHQDVARFVRSNVGEALAQRRERVNACLQGAAVTEPGDGADSSAHTQSLSISNRPAPAPRSRRWRAFIAAAGAISFLGAVIAIRGSASPPTASPEPPSRDNAAPVAMPSAVPAPTTTAAPARTTTAAPMSPAPAHPPTQAGPLTRPPRRRTPPMLPTPPAPADTGFRNPY